MADVHQAEGNLLSQKWGPMPVWVWALAGLAAAWIFAKYKQKTSAAAAAAAGPDETNVSNASDGEAVAPQFIIENNMPNVNGGNPSTPVPTPVVTPPPAVTPPGTITKPPVVAPPVTALPVKTPPAAAKKPIAYVVKSGDTLSAIAARYKTTAAKLFTYNTTPGVRPASTIATLKSRGPNLLFAGETIYIPQ